MWRPRRRQLRQRDYAVRPAEARWLWNPTRPLGRPPGGGSPEVVPAGQGGKESLSQRTREGRRDGLKPEDAQADRTHLPQRCPPPNHSEPPQEQALCLAPHPQPG